VKRHLVSIENQRSDEYILINVIKLVIRLCWWSKDGSLSLWCVREVRGRWVKHLTVVKRVGKGVYFFGRDWGWVGWGGVGWGFFVGVLK